MAPITAPMPVAVTEVQEDLAKLVTRVTVGALILVHTWAVVDGEQAIHDTLMALGLPVGLAWTSLIFEGFAPAMVIPGVYALHRRMDRELLDGDGVPARSYYHRPHLPAGP
jgi:hypothetical protein